MPWRFDFFATAVLAILVGGLMRLAFFAAIIGFFLVAFTSFLASSRIFRSFALNVLAMTRGLNVHQLRYVVDRMRASKSFSVVLIFLKI